MILNSNTRVYVRWNKRFESSRTPDAVGVVVHPFDMNADRFLGFTKKGKEAVVWIAVDQLHSIEVLTDEQYDSAR